MRLDKPSTMKCIDSKTFTAKHPGGALEIATLNGVTVRLHWTNQPYRWHVNDGQEVFVVLDGEINMHYKTNGNEHTSTLTPGDICRAQEGDEHFAEPIGTARVLSSKSKEVF